MHPSESDVDAAFLAYRRTRDPAPLATVYDRTSARLLAVALHLSSSAAAAEDAVQDTFLFALENPERWDESRPLVPWLLGILGNRLKQSVHRARQTPDPARISLPDARDPHAELETGEILAQIESAITNLAQPYRAVVLLRLRNGLSPADIAVALDRKPSTVRAQLTRGIEMLRKLLPAGVATVLVGSLTTTRGLAAVRETVLGRAGSIRHALRVQRHAQLLRAWRVGLFACAAVAVTAWIGLRWMQGADPAPIAVVTDRLQDERIAVVETVSLPPSPVDARHATPQRRAAIVGALSIQVTRDGSVIPSAPVHAEPLRDPPWTFVHHTTGSRGEWDTFEVGDPAPAERHRFGRTGADGWCSIADLTPGSWLIRSLGAGKIVEVRTGEDARVEMPVEPAVRVVRGVVLDRRGVPIADAPIWICREHVTRHSQVVTRSDAAGRFELAVAPFTTVGARHPGRSPIGVSIGREVGAAPVEVVLQFTTEGARVAGRVLDQAGRPVPHAGVQIGHTSDVGVTMFAETPRVVARPVRLRADAEGRFECDGLIPGETWIGARARGFGLQGEIVTLSEGVSAEVTLSLCAGATIVGRVRGDGGAPVVGARVRIVGEVGLEGYSTTTDQAGAFCLVDVTPGSPVVEVADFLGGFACGLVETSAGSETEWNPTLRADSLRIAGRVLGPGGQPFADAWIVMISDWHTSVHHLDGAGRFSVEWSERLARHPITVWVYDRDPRNDRGAVFGVPRATVRDVFVGSDDVEIRVPAVTERPAWLSGRILDANDRPPTAAVILHTQGYGRPWRARVDPLGADGAFECGPLPPGRYTITVVGDVPRRFGPFEVKAGGPRELSVLRLGPRAAAPKSDGVLVARRLGFVFPSGSPQQAEVYVEVRDASRRLLETKSVVDWSSMFHLPRGRYTLVASTSSGLVGRREFEVDPAEEQLRAILVPLARE